MTDELPTADQLLYKALTRVERAARAYEDWADPLPPEGVDRAVELSRALEEVERARHRCVAPGHYLTSRAPGCLCILVDPGQLSGPDPREPDWEQEPNCPVHPR